MASEQADAIRAANEDDDVGAIVMTGAGRGFCAGADMQETFKTRLDGTTPAETASRPAGCRGTSTGLRWRASPSP